MADVKEKIRFLEEYREHPEKYLPMIKNELRRGTGTR